MKMVQIKDVLLKEVPVTNIESWVQLGRRKTVMVNLDRADFPYLYSEGEETDEKTIFLRGLSTYEFNQCIFEAIKSVDDIDLSEYVTKTTNIALDPNKAPAHINSAVYKQFIFELDYALLWYSMRDFHTRTISVNEQKFPSKITLNDVRSFEGIRKLSIVVYYLSGYIKEVPQQMTFFRENGARETDRIAPLPSKHVNSAGTS